MLKVYSTSYTPRHLPIIVKKIYVCAFIFKQILITVLFQSQTGNISDVHQPLLDKQIIGYHPYNGILLRTKSWVWWHTLVIPVLGRLRQEDHRFATSFSYLMRPSTT